MTVKGNPLAYLFGKLWHYSEGNRRNVIVYAVLFGAAEIVSLLWHPLIWAQIMNTIQLQGITSHSMRTLSVLLWWSLVGTIVFWALHGSARLIEGANAFRARINYRRSLLKGVMTLPMEWHTDHHSGDTIDKAEKGTGALFDFSESSFQIIYSITELIGTYAILIYFSRPAGVIVLVMVALSMWITMRFDRILITHYQELNHAENHVSESIFDAISNISTVITLRVEKLVFAAIMHKVEKPYELRKRRNRLVEIKWFLTNLCSRVMTMIVLAVYFWQHQGTSQGVLVGSIYLLSQYLDRIAELFFNFTSMYSDVIQQRARMANAEEISRDFRPESFANHVLPQQWQRLEIEGLDFSYHQDGTDLHLEGIRMSMARGERIALVGESGSGKTTLLKIMRDLYHPRNLKLSIDGQSVPQGFAGISRAIALVPPDPEIFATTILENITLGAEHDPAVVRRYTDMACFTDVVEGLPNKLNSSIKEKGVNLSSGQQQRLALSRGLLACDDKDIVLLDEPTSNLDTANEMKIYQNIFRAFRGKTIISSLHRLHLLPLFERIYMFSNGRITAAGTLDQLLVECPEFQQLWQQYHDRSRS